MSRTNSPQVAHSFVKVKVKVNVKVKVKVNVNGNVNGNVRVKSFGFRPETRRARQERTARGAPGGATPSDVTFSQTFHRRACSTAAM